jgi:hypothetical protein
MAADVATGGCLCGAVRFEYSGSMEAAAYCHCSDCRRVTGSAFNVSLPMLLTQFRIVRGAPRGYARMADSGNTLTRYFCSECGSPLFTSSPVHPDRVYVKGGALDDPSLVRPGTQRWLRSRVPWADIPPDLPGHGKGGT